MQSFEPLELDILRVAAVDGKELTLPHPDYNENNYRRFHGQRTSMGAVGCYFSHIKALKQFLESDEETALICEDDTSAKPEMLQVLNEALLYRKHWDMLRLNCLLIPTHVSLRKLVLGYRLTVPVYWAGGAGAYLVNRNAAEKIIDCSLPMYLPYDHAFEQNWRMNFTIMMVVPFPVALSEHKGQSTIGSTDRLATPAMVRYKLPFLQRYFCTPTLPYRGLMTCQRWRKQIGTALWYLLFPPKKMDENIAE